MLALLFWLLVQWSAINLVPASAAFYEITEWWIAVTVSPDVAEAYLGSRGDPWDSQKDMRLDGIGAICGVLVFRGIHDRQIERLEGAARA